MVPPCMCWSDLQRAGPGCEPRVTPKWEACVGHPAAARGARRSPASASCLGPGFLKSLHGAEMGGFFLVSHMQERNWGCVFARMTSGVEGEREQGFLTLLYPSASQEKPKRGTF